MSVHAIDAAPRQSYGADEIAFLSYRLDVVNKWPDSEYRAATIQAIMARLLMFEV
jgi:hypothetical protein